MNRDTGHIEYRTGHHDPREITKFGPLPSPSLSCYYINFKHQLPSNFLEHFIIPFF